MLFTMSMRMCSLASNVHGEHSRNTTLNSTHCSSSQEFDEVSKILRTMALTADTITAARISHARRLPIQVLARRSARCRQQCLEQCVEGAHLVFPSARPAAPAAIVILCYAPRLGQAKPGTLIRCRHWRQW